MQKEKVIQVCGGSGHTLALTQRGHVYSMGCNNYGQLGLGADHQLSNNNNDRKTPFQIDPVHFDYEKIIQICCGYFYSMALTQKGNVYSWGNNAHGQLGQGNVSSQNAPKKINHDWSLYEQNPNEKIKYISSGQYHSFALSQNNKLYAWGLNHYGQLGLNLDNQQSIPTLIDCSTYNNEKIIKMECGDSHTLLLTQKLDSHDSTNFYTCGSNNFGELGLGHNERRNTFQLVDSNHFNHEKIIKMECGDSHTLLLTQKLDSHDSTNFYTCGSNNFGELGLGHNERRNTFQLVDSNHFNHEKIKDIKAGGFFSMALTQENGFNKLYSWGLNHSGQLGFNDTNQRNVPNQIHFPSVEKDIQIQTIQNGMFYSFATIKEHGHKRSKIYAWGHNLSGQLGMNHFKNPLKPAPFDMNYFKSEEIVSIGSNSGVFGYSFAISKTGKLFAWGCNKFGQLGLNHSNNTNEPQLCCPDLFGTGMKNQKMYKNQSFEDVKMEFH